MNDAESSWFFINCNPWMRFCSSEGASSTALGKTLNIAMSMKPWCTAPSPPTNPARSMHILTGRFCSETSWKIWSRPRCAKVE